MATLFSLLAIILGVALGMAVQASVRPAMWTFWEPYVDFFESPFYREHPEWRTLDRDGTPVTRMSWAVTASRRWPIMASNSEKASALYSLSGSRWP